MYFVIIIFIVIIFTIIILNQYFYNKDDEYYTNFNYKYNLVIVSIFKNEAVAMKEWLSHYVNQGVEHFYLINNGSTDNWESQIKGFPVTIITDNTKYKQVKLYNKYYKKLVKKLSRWVMVVDLDEFLYARNGYNTITEYLDTIPNEINQISIRWKMFGSNGYIDQPESIIKSFTKRKKFGSKGYDLNHSKNSNFILEHHVKSISRTNKLIKLDIHTSNLKNNKQIILPENPTENELEKSPLHLNHYAIQSLNWFLNVKKTRGDADINYNNRDEEYFKSYDYKEIIDEELSELSKLSNSICIIQADNREPESFYLEKTMIVNKRAALRLKYDYEFIKFDNENNIHPATLKIKIINNVLKNTKYEIIIFIDSDAWCNDLINLNNIVNYLINSKKHGCYSRDPLPYDPEKKPWLPMDINHNNTYINSGVFILKVNDYTKKMYDNLENELINDSNYINLWPYDQYYISNFVYKNRNDFFIFDFTILNTPDGKVIRHNWFKNSKMHKDLNYLINNKIDVNYNKNFNLSLYIQ